jgi:hypothetical protein
VWDSEFTSKAAKKIDLIQTQVEHRQTLRVEVYARALRASQTAKRSTLGTAKLFEEGGAEELVLDFLLWSLAQFCVREYPDGRGSRATTRAQRR